MSTREGTVSHRMTTPRLSTSLALLAALLGLSALLGWALDIAALKQGLASSVAMNPATAVCLVLLGLEAIRMNALNAHAALAKAGQLAILVVIAAGLAKLCDLVFGTSFAIDQMLFGATLEAESRYPSRMAPNTAACLVLLGVAMQLMRGGPDGRARNAQLLAVLVLLAGLLALAGNLFSVRELSGPLQYIPMAFNTALAVCCIAASVLSYSRHKGLMKFFRWESIQNRVTVASMAIFVTGVWSLTLYSSSVLRDDLQRQLGAQQFSTVSVLAAEIDQEMDDRLRALETIAAEFTPAMLRDPALQQAVLDQRPLLRPLFNGGVMVLSSDGTALADVPRLAGRRGRNYMDNTDIAAVLKGAKATISRPVIGRVLKAPAFGITVPVRDAQGRVIGAMVGLTNLSQPNFLGRITQQRYGSTGDYLLAESQYRLIFAGSDKNRIMTTLPAPGVIPALDHYFQGGEGSAVFVNPLGVEILASAKHIPVAGWVLAAILPTEEAFAPIHARFERAVNGANDGIWDWIPATGEAYLSPRWKQLLGYADHELPNGQESFFNRIHGDDLARVQEAVRANFQERKPYQVELRLRCKSGEYRWFSSRGQAEWDQQGQPRRMSGSIADITERKQAEAALQEITTRTIAGQAAALEAQRQSRLAALNLLEDARAARAQAEVAGAALAQRNEQLSRLNRVAVDRELTMINLKQQVNALARELGREAPFALVFLDKANDGATSPARALGVADPTGESA